MVGWLFLPQNSGLVVGTYEGCSVDVHRVAVLFAGGGDRGNQHIIWPHFS